MDKEIIFAFVFLSPFAIVFLWGLSNGIKGLIREIDYQINGNKQHLMFNQLKKGDFVWLVNEDKLFRKIIKKVAYNFSGTDVITIKIYFHGYDNYLSIPSDKSKTYRFGNYYTIMGEAMANANYIKHKRQESIDGVRTSTDEDILKAVNDVINRTNKIKNNIKNS